MTGPDQPEGLDKLDRPVEPVETRPPAFVIRGEASAEEVAALVVVLQSAAAAAAAREPDRRTSPEWSAPRRALHGPHVPGPGAWRASALPR